MSVAFVFAGQGGELATVAPELAGAVPTVAALVGAVATELRLAPDQLWHGGGRLLERTDVYQPVLVAMELGIHAALADARVAPAAVAGHSLGEVAAWAAAGALTAEEAIHLAIDRGRIMAEAARAHPGGLLALRDPARVEAALAAAAPAGTAYLAAQNAPDEWLVGGDLAALRAIARLGPLVRVPVPGPWHGPLMAEAAERLRGSLAGLPTRPLRTRLVSSVTGALVEGSDGLPDLLARQLAQPVRWVEALRTLVALGTDEVVTVGPGKVLRALLRRNGLEAVTVHGTDTPVLLARTIDRLRP